MPCVCYVFVYTLLDSLFHTHFQFLLFFFFNLGLTRRHVERHIAQQDLEIEELWDAVDNNNLVFNVKNLNLPVELPLKSIDEVSKMEGWLHDQHNYAKLVIIYSVFKSNSLNEW